MFPGMSLPKLDKAAVLKQLKTPRAMFGLWYLAIRVTPYIIDFFTAEKEELKLEHLVLIHRPQHWLQEV